MIVKANSAIIGPYENVILFSFDSKAEIKEGDKLDLSIANFKDLIELNEKAIDIIREETVYHDYEESPMLAIRRYTVVSKTMVSKVYIELVNKAIMAIDGICTDLMHSIANFDIFLWKSNYPVVFIEIDNYYGLLQEKISNKRKYRYGFVISPIGDEHES